MTDEQYVHAMMCAGFGLGCIFWSFVWWVLMGGKK